MVTSSVRSIKKPSRFFPTFVRNWIRLNRFGAYGWVCFGKLLYWCVQNEPQKIAFWLKRSYWIYNFVNYRVMFHSRVIIPRTTK